MRKIPTLFERNWTGDRLVRDVITPGCEWVVAGEGVATAKIDGTACLVRDGKLFKRFELKAGKPAPAGFEPAQELDPVTGDVPGWIPVGSGPEDRWHLEAWTRGGPGAYPDGTYELVGPKVQGNPQGHDRHELVHHGDIVLADVPRDFAGLRDYLAAHEVEGIVWWRTPGDLDGDHCKLKRRDFGFPWPVRRGRGELRG